MVFTMLRNEENFADQISSSLESLTRHLQVFAFLWLSINKKSSWFRKYICCFWTIVKPQKLALQKRGTI